jgi:hypothetical protein
VSFPELETKHKNSSFLLAFRQKNKITIIFSTNQTIRVYSKRIKGNEDKKNPPHLKITDHSW